MDVKVRPKVNGGRPDFSAPRTDGGCYFAAIELAVDASGIPEPGTARVLRTNDTMFATAVMATVPGYAFSPARIGDKAVRQLYEFSTAMTTQVASSRAAALSGPGSMSGRRPPCAARR